ncbi:hypothetical protein ABII15_24220 [Streptomyces sp. HUAS MG91]|uniref:ATP-binding protein n=1 Tax=Streptomyces tabacisoli TaxID=3156398 RepID=A0AAU8IWR8_9ACTN
MARHAQPTPSTRTRRSLLNAGLVVGAAGAALVAGGGAAGAAVPQQAADGSDVAAATQAVTQALHGSTASGLGTLKTLQLDPLAGTGVDPLDNGVGTQIADFKPIGSSGLTEPLTSGGSLEDLPLVGPATHLLPN